MTVARLRSAIPGALGAARVAVANIWERAGVGLSVTFVVLDDETADRTLVVGDVVEAGGRRWELVGIDPTVDPPSADFRALDVVPSGPGPETQGPTAADARPRSWWASLPPARQVARAGVPHQTMVDVLVELASEAFALLGVTVTVVDWEVTTDESFTHSWPGEQLGPNHTGRRRAVFDGAATGASFEVSTSTNRWNEQDVANRSVGGVWCTGDQTTSVSASWEGNSDDATLFLRGSTAVHQLVLDHLDRLVDGGR